VFKKNTAVTGFPIGLFINATTGAVVTTGTPTCKRILDGTGAACANAASYNSDAGQWEIDLEAADTNGNVVGYCFTLTDCLPITYRFRTVQVDLNDAVRGGMTALPNAAADAAGGLPISDAGGLDMDALATYRQSVIRAEGRALSIPHGETVHFSLFTVNPVTGALQDADTTPTWKIWGETGDTPNLFGNMTKRTGLTGHYKASFEVKTIDGFDPGEFFQVVGEATVGGISSKAVVMTFRVLAAESAVGRVPVDGDAIADAVLAREVSEVEAEAPEHSLCTVVLAALESSISSTEWIIKRTDGTTTHVTKIVTTDPDAEPITGVS